MSHINSYKINDFDTSEELYDYLNSKDSNSKLNQVLKSIPSNARKLVNEDIVDLIRLNIQYHHNLIKFLSKVGGSYKDSKKLYSDLTDVISKYKGGWFVDNYVSLVNDTKGANLIYSDDRFVIADIQTFEASNKLGIKSFCISRDKNHYDNYTIDFQRQYFIWDFSYPISNIKHFMGITVNHNGKFTEKLYSDNETEININDIIDIVQYLKPYDKNYIKANIDLTDYQEVIKYGFIDELKELIDKGWNPSTDNNRTIRWVSENGHVEIVKLLLKDSRVDPSNEDNYAIRWASENGHTEIVKLLLKDNRVDPSDKSNSAIRWASENGHTEIVKLLLKDSRVDPSDKDNYAIRWASENGHTEIVKLLLKDNSVDPSDEDNYAIRWASENGHIGVVKLLLKDSRVREKMTKEEIEKYETI
jgi:hypothetical protein